MVQGHLKGSQEIKLIILELIFQFIHFWAMVVIEMVDFLGFKLVIIYLRLPKVFFKVDCFAKLFILSFIPLFALDFLFFTLIWQPKPPSPHFDLFTHFPLSHPLPFPSSPPPSSPLPPPLLSLHPLVVPLPSLIFSVIVNYLFLCFVLHL